LVSKYELYFQKKLRDKTQNHNWIQAQHQHFPHHRSNLVCPRGHQQEIANRYDTSQATVSAICREAGIKRGRGAKGLKKRTRKKFYKIQTHQPP
jgi:hypothetical protein